MLLRQTLIAFILTVFLPLFSFGQTRKSEHQLKNYLLQLKESKVDTFLIIKSGCVGCYIKYDDSSKGVTDGQTVYVLSKQMGKFTITSFDDFGTQRSYATNTCSLFDTVTHYKLLLQQKDIYYKKMRKESGKVHFLPPRPIHYSYDDLEVKISKFNYQYTLVENDSGMFKFPERKEKWYMTTKKIIDHFFSFLKSFSP